MKISEKLLFTCIAAALVLVGMLAITEETHTGYSRGKGVSTLEGEDAKWFGQTCLLLAVLPLLVWLPKRWVGTVAVVWGLSLMAWIFGPYLIR